MLTDSTFPHSPSSSFRRLYLPIFAVFLSSLTAAHAASYSMPNDDVLVRKAEVILRGTVTKVESLKTKDGSIVTDTTVSVTRVLKGARDLGTIRVRQPGGTVGDESFVVPGIGAFTPHEEVLLMLDRSAAGAYRLTDFALGKFHVGRARDGSEFLRRDGLTEAHLIGAPAGLFSGAQGAPGATIVDPDRDAAGFETFIADVLAERLPAAGYVLPSRQIDAGPSVDFVLLGAPPSRRNEFDAMTTVNYKDNASGDPGSFCPTGCHAEVAAGVVDWNALPGAMISLGYNGTDGTIGTKCFGNLVNQIQFGDHCTDMTALSGCTGTLAIGGFAASSSGGVSGLCATDPNGPVTLAFNKIVRAAIEVNTGTGSCLNSCDYEDMIAHETGHTIGADHSADTQALMAPFLVHLRCGAPMTDDLKFAQCVYPQLFLACNVSASPTVGRHPLDVAFNPGRTGGTGPFTFDWEFGDGGSDTAELPTHTYLGPGIFTAQVTVTDSNLDTCTDSIDINVQPCLPPTVTSATAKLKSGVLRAVVLGSGFLRHATVQIDSGGGFVSAPKTSFKRKTKVVGVNVAPLWPAGAPVMIRVLSPTGCPSNAVSVTR
jgi:PKD domain-containing protein/matrixin